MNCTITPPPMRGIKQAVAEIRTSDPNTALTEKALRRMILTGEIPYVTAGRKYLVNLNTLYNYLNTGTIAEQPKIYNGLRVIKE